MRKEFNEEQKEYLGVVKKTQGVTIRSFSEERG
jgi:hypothetical protein